MVLSRTFHWQLSANPQTHLVDQVSISPSKHKSKHEFKIGPAHAIRWNGKLARSLMVIKILNDGGRGTLLTRALSSYSGTSVTSHDRPRMSKQTRHHLLPKLGHNSPMPFKSRPKAEVSITQQGRSQLSDQCEYVLDDPLDE